MNYIELRTSNLVTLVGRNSNDAIDWESIGTNADTINLDTIKLSEYDVATGSIYYILPVIDLVKANTFVYKCSTIYGVEVNVLDDVQALTAREAFLASLPEPEEEVL